MTQATEAITFEDGWIRYEARLESADALEALLRQDWTGGFIACARGEVLLSDSESIRNALAALAGTKNKAGDWFPGLEGPVMEAGFWRSGQDFFQETAVEREDAGFLVQQMQLATNQPPDQESDSFFPCYFREVQIQTRKGQQLSGRISAMETITPASRLHLFLTTDFKAQ